MGDTLGGFAEACSHHRPRDREAHGRQGLNSAPKHVLAHTEPAQTAINTEALNGQFSQVSAGVIHRLLDPLTEQGKTRP